MLLNRFRDALEAPRGEIALTSSGVNPGSGSRVLGTHARIIRSSPPEKSTPLPPRAMHWTFSPLCAEGT